MTTISDMTLWNSVGAEDSNASSGTASREPESTTEELQGKVADKPYGANTATVSGTMEDIENKQAAFDPDITDPKAEKEAMEMESNVSACLRVTISLSGNNRGAGGGGRGAGGGGRADYTPARSAML